MRYAVLLLVNAAVMIPFSFFTFALPAILREAGVSLELIGLTGVIYLPVIFAFLWAPVIDNGGRHGKATPQKWMAALLLAMTLLTAAMAFLRPGDMPAGILGLALLIGVLAASARTALLGYSVRALEETERSTGSAFLLAGSALASLAGASGLLLLYDRAGWSLTLAAMALLLALPLLSLAPSRQAPLMAARPRQRDRARITVFFRRPHSGRMLHFLFWLGLAVGLGFGMLPPLLVDVGFVAEDIALINATLTFGALLAGGPIAALLVRRSGLVVALPLGLAVNVLVYLQASAGAYLDLPRIYTAVSVGLFFLAFSFLGVMTNTLFMNFSDAGQESTDLSLINAAYIFMSIIGASCSGLIAASAGYESVFAAGAACALISIWVSLGLPKGRAQSEPSTAAVETL